MKNIFKVLIFSLFSFLLIEGVNAESVVSDLKLECTSPVGYETTFDCTLTGKISNSSNLESVEVTDITNSRMFKTTNLINYDVKGMSGTGIRLATYTGKTNKISGKASVGLRIAYNDIYFKYVTYRLKINDTNANLSSIAVDNEKIDNFNKDNTSYSIKTNKEKITLGAKVSSNRADVSGLGEKKLACGSNNFKINVVAESGDKKTYSISINRECNVSSDVALTNLKFSTGKLTTKFDPKVNEYKLIVDKNTSKISLTGEAKTDLVVTGNLKDKEINPGFNKFTITVAGKNNVKKDYIIEVIRQKDDAYLSTLSLSSGAINFDRNIFNYETTVVYDTINVDVRAVPESGGKVEIVGGKNLKVGDNFINVKVISDTYSENNYKIKLVRLKQDETIGDNPTIKNIKIKDYDINFDPNIVNYSLKIKNEKKLDIEVITDDDSTKTEILGNKNLKDGSIITIKSTSSGGFVKLYKIAITKTNSLIYFIVGIVFIICIIGIIIVLYLLSRKQGKVPIINASLLSRNKEKTLNRNNNSNRTLVGNKNTRLNIDKDTKDINPNNIITSNNTNQENKKHIDMIKCPRCSFEMPSNISTCPNCKLKLK